MKEIQLTQGQVALIDDADFDLIRRYTWRAMYNPNTYSFYAVTSIPCEGHNLTLLMHRLILNLATNVKVDHKNRNTLDNRRDNLRSCNDLQSVRNRGIFKNNTTGFKGVSFNSNQNKFTARLSHNHQSIFLGYFDTAEKASAVYEAKAKELHKEFYYKNFEQV